MNLQIEAYIRMWERRCYPNGIPDEVPTEINDLAPSYRRIAIAILKNDPSLKSLGFTPKTSQYYHILKRIELTERVRDNPPFCPQLSLFNYGYEKI